MKNSSYAHLSLSLADLNIAWREILEQFETISYKRGKIIHSNSLQIYFLEEGTIKAICSSSMGIEWILFFQQQGCIFNELGFFGDRSVMNYQCHTDVKLRIIPASFINNQKFTKVYPHLMLDLLKTLAVKESICYSYVSDLAFASARGRVCQALLSLAKDHKNKQTFIPELSQTDISMMMGLHQTSVARVVKQLRQEGIIGAYTKKKLEILDYKKLQNFE